MKKLILSVVLTVCGCFVSIGETSLVHKTAVQASPEVACLGFFGRVRGRMRDRAQARRSARSC